MDELLCDYLVILMFLKENPINWTEDSYNEVIDDSLEKLKFDKDVYESLCYRVSEYFYNTSKANLDLYDLLNYVKKQRI